MLRLPIHKPFQISTFFGQAKNFHVIWTSLTQLWWGCKNCHEKDWGYVLYGLIKLDLEGFASLLIPAKKYFDA